MTIILNCLTPKYAIQVSDRRLTLPNGDIFNDHSNKAIFVNGHIVFSYTGLAFIDGHTRNDDWFLDVLANIYKEHPNGSFTTITEHIADRATETIRVLRISPTFKRLAFVGVGWGKSTSEADDRLRPIYFIISNTHGENGKWLTEAQPRFSVLPFTPSEEKRAMLVADGQPLSDDLRKRLRRQIDSCVAKEAGPRSITRLLIAAVRIVAATNPRVGRNLLVNCIPKDSVQPGRLIFMGKPPTSTVPTFTYVPENTSIPVQYGPHVFGFGVSCSGMVVRWNPKAS
ncbi:hypothetical protein KA005_79970 [bacterium]|nr:hypothetical protein [bacterium]